MQRERAFERIGDEERGFGACGTSEWISWWRHFLSPLPKVQNECDSMSQNGPWPNGHRGCVNRHDTTNKNKGAKQETRLPGQQQTQVELIAQQECVVTRPGLHLAVVIRRLARATSTKQVRKWNWSSDLKQVHFITVLLTRDSWYFNKQNDQPRAI